MTPVRITLNRSNVVVAISNNNEFPGYNKVKVEVGDKIRKDFLEVMLMNPHRFKIARK